jgi:nuclease S1
VRRPRSLGSVLLVVALALAAPRPAAAWGCEGHRAIAILAERLMTPAAVLQAQTLLAAHPIDPALRRFCPGTPADPFVDASTWADDYRTVDRETAPWHFIDFPLSVDATHADYHRYCPGGRCIVDAIVAQFRVLTTTPDAGGARRADALRFLIHLIGDIQQPLHDITNGDQGGNCLPVTYHDTPPTEGAFGAFHPNLHGAWDTEMIGTLMKERHLETPADLADYLAAKYTPTPVRSRAPTTDLVVSWSRDANGLARDVAYGALAVKVPIAPPGPLTSCAANGTSERLAALHERIGAAYERAALPVIGRQLTAGAVRLAEALDAAFGK